MLAETFEKADQLRRKYPPTEVATISEWLSRISQELNVDIRGEEADRAKAAEGHWCLESVDLNHRGQRASESTRDNITIDLINARGIQRWCLHIFDDGVSVYFVPRLGGI